MNRMSIAAAALLAVALGTSVSFGQVDYWGRIVEVIREGEDGSRMAAKAADAYLRSLTQEQLILAGRQCSIAMTEEFTPSGWDRAGMMTLVFFNKYYPIAEGGLDNLEPIWRELHGKDGSAFWRRSLVYILTSRWGDKWTHTQAVQVITHLGDILRDSTDSIHVRNKIPLSLARLIVKEQKRIVTAKLQDEEFSKLIEETSRNYMRLFAELTTPVSMKKELLSGLYSLFKAKVSTSEEIAGFMQELFYNYEGVDCLLWPQLASIGTEMKLPRAQEVVDKMLKDIPDRIKDAQTAMERLQSIARKGSNKK